MGTFVLIGFDTPNRPARCVHSGTGFEKKSLGLFEKMPLFLAISSFFPVLSISLTYKWHPAGGWWVLTWSNIFYDDTNHVEGQKGLEVSLDENGNF